MHSPSRRQAVQLAMAVGACIPLSFLRPNISPILHSPARDAVLLDGPMGQDVRGRVMSTVAWTTEFARLRVFSWPRRGRRFAMPSSLAVALWFQQVQNVPASVAVATPTQAIDNIVDAASSTKAIQRGAVEKEPCMHLDVALTLASELPQSHVTRPSILGFLGTPAVIGVPRYIKATM